MVFPLLLLSDETEEQKVKKAIVYGGKDAGTNIKDFSYRGKDPSIGLARKTGLIVRITDSKETDTAHAWEFTLFEKISLLGGVRYVGKVWIKTLKN